MSIRVVAVQVSVLSNDEATVSVTAEQFRRSVDPASGRLLEERVLQRGTMRLPDVVEKCRIYAAYFAALRRSGTNERSPPDVLVLTTSPSREGVVWHTLARAFEEVNQPPGHVFTSLASLVQHTGPYDPIWRAQGESRRIRLWETEAVVLDHSGGGATTPCGQAHQSTSRERQTQPGSFAILPETSNNSQDVRIVPT